MDESTAKFIAQQLRKPEGKEGVEVGNQMNQGNYHINLYTLDFLNLQQQNKILEIGMGNGHFVKNIFEIECSLEYMGCDYSEEMIREATQTNTQLIQQGKASFHYTNGYNLPFENSNFDTVFTINTLYFWDDIQHLFAELRRVLKPKGELVIAIRPKRIMQNYPFVKHGFTMYDQKELEAVVGKNGFTVLETKEIDEPEFEFNGQTMRTATLLIRAQK